MTTPPGSERGIPDDRELIRLKAADAAARFPWYRGLLADAEAPPLITSEILDRHYYSAEVEADRGVYRTSGTSSGNRRRIYYSDADDERYLETKSRVFGEFVRKRRFPIDRAASDLGTGHAASTAGEVFRRVGLRHTDVPFDQPIGEHVAVLREVRPQLLYTMPSILEALVKAVPDPREFGIRAVILVGESAGREWIKNVAARNLGVDVADVMDTYGSIELGLVAYYSHEHDRYVTADGIVAEGVTPAEAGLDCELGREEAILVVTSQIRDAFPAVRFVTYDVVRGLRPGGPGGGATFESIVKRVGPEYKHGEKISLHDIEAAVYKHTRDALVRVRVENNRLRVFISSEEMNDALLRAIHSEVERAIPELATMISNGVLDPIEVIAAPVDQLPKYQGRAKQR